MGTFALAMFIPAAVSCLVLWATLNVVSGMENPKSKGRRTRRVRSWAPVA